MELYEAREIAAKAWCDNSTSRLDMIPELAEAFAKILVEEVGRASPASVPGWKLVPDVPTSTMVLAGEKALSEHDFLRTDSAYCAMLATAPTPPVSEDKDKIIAAANALENIASTSSSTRIRRVANDALTAIRARRNHAAPSA